MFIQDIEYPGLDNVESFLDLFMMKSVNFYKKYGFFHFIHFLLSSQLIITFFINIQETI